MTNFKKKVIGIMSATAVVASLAVSASAASFSSTAATETYYANVADDIYVNQSLENPYNTSTNYVLNSTYEGGATQYSLTGIYGAQPFTVKNAAPSLRHAVVGSYTSSGTVVATSGDIYTNEEDVTAFAQINNKTLSSNIDYVKYIGDSRVSRTSSSNVYCKLECKIYIDE